MGHRWDLRSQQRGSVGSMGMTACVAERRPQRQPQATWHSSTLDAFIEGATYCACSLGVGVGTAAGCCETALFPDGGGGDGCGDGRARKPTTTVIASLNPHSSSLASHSASFSSPDSAPSQALQHGRWNVHDAGLGARCTHIRLHDSGRQHGTC